MPEGELGISGLRLVRGAVVGEGGVEVAAHGELVALVHPAVSAARGGEARELGHRITVVLDPQVEHGLATGLGSYHEQRRGLAPAEVAALLFRRLQRGKQAGGQILRGIRGRP